MFRRQLYQSWAEVGTINLDCVRLYLCEVYITYSVTYVLTTTKNIKDIKGTLMNANINTAITIVIITKPGALFCHVQFLIKTTKSTNDNE